MNFNPIPAWIEVLIGFKWRESFISWLFNPKLRLDPPMNIILFFLVSLSKLSLSFNANNKDLEAFGVAGSIITLELKCSNPTHQIGKKFGFGLV